jgi:hypothetical protein
MLSRIRIWRGELVMNNTKLKEEPKICPYCKQKIYIYFDEHVAICKFKQVI